MTAYSRTERNELADLLADLGPTAPTLNEGWRTADLCAHLVLRERPTELVALLAERVRGADGSFVEQMQSRHDIDELLSMLRAGPPWSSPLAIDALERRVNTAEFYIHHEDVRRAQPDWEPRSIPEGLSDALWGQLRLQARMLTRKAPAGLVLRRPDGRTVLGRTALPTVTLTGPPGELLLYVFGRQRVARVQADGNPDAVRAMAEASFGF